jgi:Phage portal protein
MGLVYRVDGQRVDSASIWHVRAFTTAGSVVGLSPIAHARQAVGLGLGAERYAAKFFGENAIPSGILTTDQDIKPGRAEEIKERWEARHRVATAPPCSATAPGSSRSRSRPSKPSSWRRPRRTCAPSPATSPSSPS